MWFMNIVWALSPGESSISIELLNDFFPVKSVPHKQSMLNFGYITPIYSPIYSIKQNFLHTYYVQVIVEGSSKTWISL